MKKAVSFVIIIMVMSALLVPAAYTMEEEESPVRVFVNLKELLLEVPPRVIDEQLIVPARPFLEALGAGINWDAENKTVTVTREGSMAVLQLNENYVEVDGEKREIEAPATITGGVTMVPMSFLSRFMGLDVHWDSSEKVIEVISSDFVPFVKLTGEENAELAPPMQQWVERLRGEPGMRSRMDGGFLYILATYGPKPTGGYEVEIISISRREGAFRVEVEYRQPGLEHSVLQVFSRPYDLVRVDLSGEEKPAYIAYHTSGLEEEIVPFIGTIE